MPVLIRGPVLSVLADNAPTARTVQLHEPPAVNIAGGETRLKPSFACHQCEHVVSVRDRIMRRQCQVANITFRRGIGGAFVFAFRFFRVNNGLARIGFVFSVLRGHSAASLILALAIVASNNSHLHAAWPTGKTIRLNGFSEFDEPSFWNNGCSQYVAALLLKSIDINVDKELYRIVLVFSQSRL